jgi:hypothetical protein
MHKTSTTPKDVFLHLLMIVTLYISVINGITLIFQYINLALPDSLDFYYRGILDTIRWSSSSLIIAFPVYVLTSRLIGNSIRKTPEKKEIGIRKWLIYLTLFVAAITIIVDLILLVFNFYSGELTLKFLFKLITVLIFTGTIFGYYLWELGTKTLESKKNKLFCLIATILVVISVIIGFLMVGSPMHQRDVRMDDQRTNDLQWIQSEIIEYWRNKDVLPESIDILENDLRGFTPPLDPETESNYEYEIIGNLSFKLCTEFKTESFELKNKEKLRYPREFRDPFSKNWNHKEGHVCFERTIDPDFYQDDIRR